MPAAGSDKGLDGRFEPGMFKFGGDAQTVGQVIVA